MSETPTPAFIPQIRLYQNWLRDTRGLSFDSYDALWRWSTTELDAFWQSIWDYFDLQSPTPHTAVLEKNVMPGAKWFPGAQANYAQQVLRHVGPAQAAGFPAIISRNEKGQQHELSWPELRRQVASLALHLQEAGRAARRPRGRLPAQHSRDHGGLSGHGEHRRGLERLRARHGHERCARPFPPDRPGGADRLRRRDLRRRDFDRLGVVAEMRAALPTLRHVILHRNLGHAGDDKSSDLIADYYPFALGIARNDAQVAAFEPLWLPFDHPLWIVYSSGTTGLPKPIVHGHGGTVIVALALKIIHNDVGCSYHPNNWGERYHWYSSTGWVMWNAQTSGLLNGTTCVIFDGNPGGSKDRPDWTTLWRFGAELGVTFFGAGAAFFANCLKAGVDLSTVGDLSRVRALGTTGSPLSPEAQQWGTAQFAAIAKTEAQKDIWWCNISGGTDFAGAFIGGHRELPQVPGEMQCRLMGCAVEAWNDAGEPVLGEVGELVCAQPIPSMPLYFVGDTNNARLLSSYFEMYPPGHGRKPGGGDLPPEAGGVWRHGDWLRIGNPATGSTGCVIFGRSDATINRHGLRMGTSELYSAVEALPEVLDSMVVDLEYLGRESYMPLFVVLRAGQALDEAMHARINGAIRTALSPRFLPNEIFQVAEIPRTLSGKKQELPIKKLLLGHPLEKVLNREAMANPGCLAWYEAFAAQHQARA
jgi:acetoacetyl-CoA synthetase